MGKRNWAIGLVVLLGSACIQMHPVSRHPLGGPPGQVKKLHVHTEGCGHVLVNGVWVVVKVGSRHRH